MKEQRERGYLQQHSGVRGTHAHVTAQTAKGSYRSLCFLVPSSLTARSMESEGKRLGYKPNRGDAERSTATCGGVAVAPSTLRGDASVCLTSLNVAVELTHTDLS